MSTVKEFFNTLNTDYDDAILVAIPPYYEMMEALVTYAFLDREAPLSLLELGAGSGNTTKMLANYYPNATITTVDISNEMLKITKDKLNGDINRIALIESDFMSLEFPKNSFDGVFSALALHHLLDPDKAVIYERIFSWLKPGGKFRVSDECMSTPATQADLYNYELWLARAKQNGASDEQIALWQDHAEHFDHYSPLTSHFDWLGKAGFTDVDVHWRQLFWNVYGGNKPQ